MDFRATGGADDAAALQAAIDKAYDNGGVGIVLVPEGRYRIGRTINLWRGIRLIGYGRRRPVLVLGAKTPGWFDSGTGKYLIRFTHTRTPEGTPVPDGTPGTMFSGISNINIEIQDGNPAAVPGPVRVANLHHKTGTPRECIDRRVGRNRVADHRDEHGGANDLRKDQDDAQADSSGRQPEEHSEFSSGDF